MSITSEDVENLMKVANQIGNCMSFLSGKDVGGGGGGGVVSDEFKDSIIDKLEAFKRTNKEIILDVAASILSNSMTEEEVREMLIKEGFI